MSKRIIRVILLIIVLVACLSILGACADEVDAPDVDRLVYDELNKIGFESGEINEESSSVDIVVKNDVSSLSLSFLQDSDTGKTTYTAYSDENCTNEISDLTLSVGENVFYVVGSTKTNSVVVKVSVTREEPPHTEHTYGDWKETEAATCIAPGVKERTCSICGKKQTETIAKLSHDLIHHDAQEATCTEIGWNAYDTCSRCKYTTYQEIAALGHDLIHHDAQEASCTEIGWNAYDTCSRCKYTTYQEITALGHNYENGVCTRCVGRLYTRVDVSGNASANGNYIYFGTYPQTCVTDGETKSALTALAGELPEEGDETKGGWTSYGYYIKNSVTNYMWYIDLECSGEKYRGVYFTRYRPFCIDYDDRNSQYYLQDDNGYSTFTVYWFKYDPIKWRILRETNGEALILCEMLIDGQEYYYQSGNGEKYRTAVANYNDEYYAGNGSTVSKNVMDNNYQYSTIRKWLNETFYNVAFTDLQKALIQAHTVKNDAASMTDAGNNISVSSGFACDDTQDKIFLLSEYEVTDSANGFGAYDSNDSERCKKPTDYAKSQGTYSKSGEDCDGNGSWWLRSPESKRGFTYTVYYVADSGNCKNYIHAYCTAHGVVPALYINLAIGE
ncbi:MAG: hypothetical protein J5781_05465 [Clostridia bacterium]|nr:hypothetical protein [Clostridia bacterium]